jgi:hypothetical protein
VGRLAVIRCTAALAQLAPLLCPSLGTYCEFLYKLLTSLQVAVQAGLGTDIKGRCTLPF